MILRSQTIDSKKSNNKDRFKKPDYLVDLTIKDKPDDLCKMYINDKW